MYYYHHHYYFVKNELYQEQNAVFREMLPYTHTFTNLGETSSCPPVSGG